jgi:hypothetical protein
MTFFCNKTVTKVAIDRLYLAKELRKHVLSKNRMREELEMNS